MSPSRLLVGVVVIGLIGTTVALMSIVRRTKGRGRFLLVVSLVLCGSATVFVLAAMIADTLGGSHGYDKPYPSFPSLVTDPDPTLHGTVAFISDPAVVTEEKSAEGPVPMKNSCARVVAAAGGVPRDVVCWPMPSRELASVAWRSDGRLRVTVFDPPDGEGGPIPVWGRIIDLSTGGTEIVADGDLADDAMPSPGPLENQYEERLVVSGGDGSLTIELATPSDTRTVLSVSDANPAFEMVSGPEWAADGKSFTFYDGRRLLTTTVADPANTSVLATGVSGAISDFGALSFAMTDREW